MILFLGDKGGEQMENYGRHFDEKQKNIREPIEVPDRPKKVPMVEVKKGYNLNVRSSQDINSEVIDILDSGTKVRVMGMDGDFIKIITSNKKIGYILSEYVKEVING